MPKKPFKLLLIEDNPDQQEMMIEAFQAHEAGFEILAADNGLTALEWLGKDHFDAIILDYSLPRMNGLEVLGKIRDEGHAIPVIMVTGQGDEKIAVESMKKGASEYIIKNKNYLETISIVVQKTIENNQIKRRLAESSTRTRKLQEISLSVAKERRVDTLTQILVDGARELIHTECAVLILLDPEKTEIVHTTLSGFQMNPENLLTPVPLQGLLGMGYSEREPVVIEEPLIHPRWKATPEHQPAIRQILSVPLFKQEKVMGVLNVMNKIEGTPFSEEEKVALSTLAVHTAVAIDNAWFLEGVEKQAVTDSLTGLYNHREFQNRLLEEVERGNRYGNLFSVLILDIDHFKTLNDTHGHVTGDQVLKEIVRLIRKGIRNADIPSRYGGEEFTVILPQTSKEDAKVVAERIRQSIEGNHFVAVPGHFVHVTVSIGISSFPEDTKTREELIIMADQALYFAKNEGRNRVCCYSETLKSAIEKDKRKLDDLLTDPKITTIRDLAMAIDAKCPYTRGHTDGVVEYATLLGDALELNDDQKKSLQLASFLHNIGTVSIPDRVLNKPGPLSPEEVKIIQAHPSLAQMLLKKSSQMELVLPAILYHHERFDGHGYPNGLKGEEIPFLARILGIAEAYHAMISVRPYRPKLTRDQAIEELKRNSGTQFDPKIVEVFVSQLVQSL
ncbi:MAG: diguanylate cyclase [Nitrospirae bacterium]|nr:diguanylate cyclase [Nitrospirota bacterium]